MDLFHLSPKCPPNAPAKLRALRNFVRCAVSVSLGSASKKNYFLGILISLSSNEPYSAHL